MKPTDEQIVAQAKIEGERTGVEAFSELARSHNGVNSAYGLGFIDGAVWCRNVSANVDEYLPFSIVWLQENLDWKQFYNLGGGNVEMTIDDVVVNDDKESGVIDICYCSSFYITVNKGLDSDGWLVSGDRHFRNDSWLPKIKTIGDFKRLFRVVTGFMLPLKK